MPTRIEEVNQLAGRHGQPARGHGLLAVGRVDVALQVGVARVRAQARLLLLQPAAARRGGRRVPDDGARARGQLRRVARRRVADPRAQHQDQDRREQHQMMRRRLHDG